MSCRQETSQDWNRSGTYLVALVETLTASSVQEYRLELHRKRAVGRPHLAKLNMISERRWARVKTQTSTSVYYHAISLLLESGDRTMIFPEMPFL